MRDTTVSKSYAETLFALATKHDSIEEYGRALVTVAGLLDDPKFRTFLETPRIDDDDKKAVVRRVFGEALPRNVVNFVLVTIDKRRQRLLRAISEQYEALVDEHLGRVHVAVTLARRMDQATEEFISDRLSEVLGKKAIPHFRVRPEILGGLVVRTADTIYDGSLRRRLEGMRRSLLRADLPTGAIGDAPA